MALTPVHFVVVIALWVRSRQGNQSPDYVTESEKKEPETKLKDRAM
jgi:hypothetical protein